MSEKVAYCYAADGSAVCIGDGPEMLVYSGANDAPMWKVFGDGLMVGVAANRERTWTLDGDGRVQAFRTMGGQKLDAEESQVNAGPPRDLVLMPDGRLIAVCRDAAVVLSRGGQQSFPTPDARAAAAGTTAFAVGDGNGNVAIYDLAGTPVGSFSVGAPVEGLAWRAQGQWLVSAGMKLFVVSADGTAMGQQVEIGGAGTLAVSADGALIAIAVGQDVVVVEGQTFSRLGLVRYQRNIGGVGFVGTWLGIGLDDGDGNRVDLATGKLCKTEAHPGRVANRWGFKAEVDPTRVRSVVTAVRAGGVPIARHIKLDGGGEGGGWSCWQIGCAISATIFLCTGCTGILGGLVWKFHILQRFGLY